MTIKTISEIEEEKVSEDIKETNLLNTFVDWLAFAETSSPENKWRTQAKEDYQFYAGKQDSAATLQKLRADKRPNPVYNEIKPKVDTLVGLAAQLKLDMSVLPTEATDSQIAEVMSATFKYFRNKMTSADVELECFEHVAKAGRSLLGHFIDTENPFKPVIKNWRVENGRYWVDPDSRDYPGMMDAKFLFVDRWLTFDEIKATTPDFDQVQAQNHQLHMRDNNPTLIFFDEKNEKIRVVEIWYRIQRQVAWFINPITQEPENIPLEDWPAYVKSLLAGVPLPSGEVFQLAEEKIPEHIVKSKKVVKYAIFTGNRILERGDNPYQGYNEDKFPYSLYAGYRDDEDNVWFGLTTMMKSPQRGLNTIMRQLILLLNSSPKGMLMHEDGAVLNIEEYKRRGSAADFDLKLDKGALTNNKVKFKDQPQIPQIYQQLIEVQSGFMKDLSGIQDVFLGVQAGSREPGITAQLRQQSGLAVLFIIFDNYRKSRLHSSLQLLSFIQQYIKSTEILRIEPNAAPFVINEVGEATGEVLNDIGAGTYDLFIEEALEGTTMRLATAKLLADFAQNNPGSIPPDVLLDQTDVGHSIKERVRAVGDQQAEANAQKAQDDSDLEWGKILIKADKEPTRENIDKAKAESKKTSTKLKGNTP